MKHVYNIIKRCGNEAEKLDTEIKESWMGNIERRQARHGNAQK